MDVAKRLDFEATDTLQAGRHQQWPVLQETTNALIALQRAVQDLSACTQQKETQIIGLAKQSAEQGIGDNDLKRLKRQFDSNKATYVNLDQKQRFMQGLYGLQLDIDHLTAEKDQYEQQLGKDAETLRAQKASNDQARSKLAKTTSYIAQTYQLVEDTTADAAKQLKTTAATLQQHAERKLPEQPAPLEQGPSQVEAQQLIEAGTAHAKQLERSMAAAEAELGELEARATAGRQSKAALQAEVERLEVLASDRTRAADADADVREAAEWCEGLLALMANLNGVSVLNVSSQQLAIGIQLRVPTSRSVTSAQAVAESCREIQHELVLQLLPSKAGTRVVGAKLTPAVGTIKQFLDAALDRLEVTPSYLLREVRTQLLDYWECQVLVEAAAEVFPPCSSSRGPPHVRLTLPNQGEVEVYVPSGTEAMQVVSLSCPGLHRQAAQHIADQINAENQTLTGCDLLTLLQRVAHAVETAISYAALDAGNE